MERLQKILAAAGYGSRRKVEELIKSGKVTVNGVIAELGSKADIEKDKIRVCGKEPVIKKKIYYLLNKPAGFICTLKDPFNRPKVVDLLPKEPRVFPVGRLDVDTTGALLLTNDGELTNLLIHPRYLVKKTYWVRVDGFLDAKALGILQKGVVLEDGLTGPAQVKIIKADQKTTLISITIHEGRKRQIKRMIKAVGHKVLSLHRAKFGPLEVKELQPGNYRELSQTELKLLKECAKLC